VSALRQRNEEYVCHESINYVPHAALRAALYTLVVLLEPEKINFPVLLKLCYYNSCVALGEAVDLKIKLWNL
jgi:hypothetical protein